MNPYDRIAERVVVQAVLDYRDTLQNLKRNSKNRACLEDKKELEEFFQSDWFCVLSDLNGKRLMKKIQEYTLGKAVAV